MYHQQREGSTGRTTVLLRSTILYITSVCERGRLGATNAPARLAQDAWDITASLSRTFLLLRSLTYFVAWEPAKSVEARQGSAWKRKW